MKLIIQIPCYNEASTIGETLAALPRTLPGFDEIEWLVIDDGSSDHTGEIAREHGADHVLRLSANRGLAQAFAHGIRYALQLGADVIVNTDGDNQYNASDIGKLTGPILDGSAEIVIGERPILQIEQFSWYKKRLQRLGSWVVRLASNTQVPDATSGFRAFARSAASHIVIFDNYTYTLETIIQAGQNHIPIASVPVRVNEVSRSSRLVRSIPRYVLKSTATIIRIFAVHRPLWFFGMIGCFLLFCGAALGIRFVLAYATGDGGGHVQSLILASILILAGFQTVMIGFMADLLSANRKLIAETRGWAVSHILSKSESATARTLNE